MDALILRRTPNRFSSALSIAGLACLMSLSGFSPSAAQSRTLNWLSLRVHAQLDDEGALHIDEQHEIEFTGDWNGGERAFQLRDGQRVDVREMFRIDPTSGARSKLVRGNLDQVDQYAVRETSDEVILRWRVRAEGAPPLRGERFTYLVSYVYHGAVVRDGDRYSLAHDFSFDRPGRLDTIEVTLDIDPQWRPVGRYTRFQRGTKLAPDAHFVVPVELAWVGPGPALVHEPPGWTPPDVSIEVVALLCLLVLVPILLVARLLRHERRCGRLEPLEPVHPEDPTWRAEHWLRHAPELVPLLWPRSNPRRVGEPQVAALLARLELEGKIASCVNAGELTLTLRVDRAQLSGYERALVDGIFFEGDVTSTRALRQHYAKTGFNPAEYLNELIAKACELLGLTHTRDKAARSIKVLVWLVGAYLLLRAAPGRGPQRLAVAIIPGVIMFVVAVALAIRWRAHLEWGVRELGGTLVAASAYIVAAVAYIALLPLSPPFKASLGAVLVSLAYFEGVLGFARTRNSREGLKLLRQLASLHLYLQERLAGGHELSRELVPYALAFGLRGQGITWRVAGQEQAGPAERPRFVQRIESHDSSRSSEPEVREEPPATFEGGGGGFGGAGATGDWVDAVCDLSCGVSPPSTGGSSGSSSSSSSGSGSSSTSGGGRAGGW